MLTPLALLVSLQAAAMAAVTPRLLGECILHPIRRPEEAERQRCLRVELELMGHRPIQWHVSGDGSVGVTPHEEAGALKLLSGLLVIPAGSSPTGERLPLVILLHPWGDSICLLRGALLSLPRRGYPAMAIDLPAHGLSAGRGCTYGVAELPALAGLMASTPAAPELEMWGQVVEGHRPVLLWGESLGGMMALRWALELQHQRPGQLHGVVAAGVPWDLGRAGMMFFQGTLGVPWPWLAHRALRHAERAGGYHRESASMKAVFAQPAELPAGLPRLLTVRGERDRLVSAEELEWLRAAWETAPGSVGSQHLSIPGHGHAGLLNHGVAAEAIVEAAMCPAS